AASQSGPIGGATRYSPVFPVRRGQPGRRRELPARRVDRRAQAPAWLDNSAHRHRDPPPLLLVRRGGGVYLAEGGRHEFAPVALISVPLSCVHGFDFKPRTDGWIVTASGG